MADAHLFDVGQAGDRADVDVVEPVSRREAQAAVDDDARRFFEPRQLAAGLGRSHLGVAIVARVQLRLRRAQIGARTSGILFGIDE